MGRALRFAAFVAALFLTQGVAAQDERERMETVNPNYDGPPVIERKVSGVHTCTRIGTGEPCGEERWTITVHTDGTRTIRSFLDQTSQGTQINLVLRADADTFRPIEAFANVYDDGVSFGTGFYVVKGDTLQVTVNTPSESFVSNVDLPEQFSLLLHPISADGWHFGAGFKKGGPPVQMHNLCTLGAAGRSVLCAVYPIPLEFVGMETVTVPAGTFETEHYKFGADTDVWIAGPDRVMIKHEYRVRQSRYELAELDGGL